MMNDFFSHLRLNLSPKTQPEFLRYKMNLARILIIAFFILLGIWLAFEVAFTIIVPPESYYSFTFDLISIASLAALGAVVLWLVSRRQLVTAGYLLASTFFIFATLSVVLFPQEVFLLSAAYLISILAAGAMVGGASTYPFAIGAVISITWNWIQTWGTPIEPSGAFDLSSSFIFLISQIVLYMGTAAILHSLSNQVERALDRLHDKTDRLTGLAQTDELTGLANRRHLIEQMEREFTRAKRYQRPLSLLYLDLDGFKALNDRHGHLFGDEVLRGCARSLRAVLRSTDLLARIGGDEFAVLLPETNLDGAENVANKLRKALMAYGLQLGPSIPPLTFCAGVSHMHKEDHSIDDMLARADGAQYLAKESGKADIRTEVSLDLQNN
jgi:diguanylate cyclase (GGDEF)-like protein